MLVSVEVIQLVGAVNIELVVVVNILCMVEGREEVVALCMEVVVEVNWVVGVVNVMVEVGAMNNVVEVVATNDVVEVGVNVVVVEVVNYNCDLVVEVNLKVVVENSMVEEVI